jgi:multiple sugar transport system ATP-binding protein
VSTVELEGLIKRFGSVSVVDNISLRVEEGEFFTFVGPSGCGKSTLLNLIAGLDRSGAGNIRIDGRVVNDLDPRDRDVAMVFQSYALYPHMTVAENIGFPMKLRGLSREDIAAAVARTARSLGIEPLLSRRPKELSGGQRQRVALGRALVRRPRVFLMDEPLSNLDARLRLEMRAELKRLHAEHRITTIYVTHDQEEAMALSDRVAVLHAGKIQQCDAPLRIYEDPANLFVAGFIGSPPMNVFDAVKLDRLPQMPSNVEAQNIVAAIRPSDIGIATEGGDPQFQGEVTLSEPTGSDIWALVRWHGQSVLARGRSDQRLVPGTKVYMDLPIECIYFFDRASGVRVR